MPLSDAQIDQLEQLLFAENMHEDCLDYFGLHGLVCASVVGPATLSTELIQEISLSGLQSDASTEQLEHFNHCVEAIRLEIQNALLHGTEAQLPYEQEEDEFDASLESWCTGFMEGFFQNENDWFSHDQEVAAELLLPIMALSGLFEAEEFQQIYANEKLMAQFETLVADQLTDIYLYYHSE